MQNYILPFVFLVVFILVFARHPKFAIRPLRWHATVLLALFVPLALWASNALAEQIGNRIFVLLLYGVEKVRRENIHVTWDSRTQVFLSNGRQMGTAASQILQLITMCFWIALLAIIVFAARSLLRRSLPTIYSDYAAFFGTFNAPRRYR